MKKGIRSYAQKQEVTMARKTKPKSTTGLVHRRSYDGTADEPIAITPVEYGGLQEGFDHFNRELFSGKLPDVFITYQRKAGMAGHFAADRYSGRIGTFGKHELALNPDAFISQTDKQICQTLVHEMTHVWQHAFGKPSARGYHNKQWAAMMKAIGLQPSNTGMVGGKETGQHMMDYIIPGGRFEHTYEKLAASGWRLILQSAHRPGGQKAPNSKVKFTCPKCGEQNVWGKPDTRVDCHDCKVKMVSAIEIAAPAEPTPPAPSEPEPIASYEPTPELEPVTRKRGRPKGSKNKPNVLAQSYEQEPQQLVKRGPGRPKGSKNKPKAQVAVAQSYERQAI
jgi:hypothetical protein